MVRPMSAWQTLGSLEIYCSASPCMAMSSPMRSSSDDARNGTMTAMTFKAAEAILRQLEAI